MNPAFIVWPLMTSAFGAFIVGSVKAPDDLLTTIAQDAKEVGGWLLSLAEWLGRLAWWLLASALPYALASLPGWLRRIGSLLSRRKGTHAKAEAAAS